MAPDHEPTRPGTAADDLALLTLEQLFFTKPSEHKDHLLESQGLLHKPNRLEEVQRL